MGDKLTEYAGKTKEEIVLNWLDVVHPDDHAHTIEVWTAAVQHQHKYEVEFRMRRYDGVYRWHLTEGIPEYDDAGRCSAMNEQALSLVRNLGRNAFTLMT